MPAIPLAQLTERIGFLDPASGTTKAKRQNQARSAVVVVAVDDLGRVFVLHAWADRVATPDIITHVLDTQRAFHCTTFGIEANAQQSLFADVLVQEALRQEILLPTTYVYQPPSLHKNERIRAALQPLTRAGRLFLQPHQAELRHELQTFPTGRVVDLIDALASTINLIPPRKLASRTRPQQVQAAIQDYLRRAGTSPSVQARYGALFSSR